MTSLWTDYQLKIAMCTGLVVLVNLLASIWFLSLTDPSLRDFISTQDAVKYGYSPCWTCDSHRPEGTEHCYHCGSGVGKVIQAFKLLEKKTLSVDHCDRSEQFVHIYKEVTYELQTFGRYLV